MKLQYDVIKFNNDNLELDVRVSPLDETIWLSIDQMALLFGRDKSVISRHIKNIFSSGELIENSCVAFFATELNKYDHRTQKMRKTVVNIKLFNLDVAISVGYRVNSIMGVRFRQWANSVLKEYLLKGYVINKDRTLVTNENYVRLINKVESLDERVSNIEKEHKQLEHKNKQLIFDGEFYDAYSFIQTIFEKAENEIIIIDNFIDRTILDRLVVKREDVKVVIYTNTNSKLLESDINSFNKQYGILEVKYTNNVHDRFIIIDDKILYHLGHSIKDLGKKIFSISELDNSLIKDLLNKMKVLSII